MSRPAKHPIFLTLATSMIVAGGALAIWGFAPAEFPRTHTTLLGLGLASAIAALVLGRLLRLGNAWVVLVTLATPSLVLVPIYQPPVWVFPSLVLLLAGFYINGVREQVPLYLSNPLTQSAIAEIAQREKSHEFIDLGCGLGDIVCAVAKAQPETRVIGYETAPLSFLIAWARAGILRQQNADIRFQSIWHADVSNADIVYAFLSPAPMTRLQEKLKAEMKPGALFISNSFAVPGGEPDEIIAVDDSRQTQLLIWRM